MNDEPDNLMLVDLRRLDGKMDTVIGDLRDLRNRVGLLEAGLTNVRREISISFESYGSLAVRMDGIDDRLSRIERRLDIVHA